VPAPRDRACVDRELRRDCLPAPDFAAARPKALLASAPDSARPGFALTPFPARPGFARPGSFRRRALCPGLARPFARSRFFLGRPFSLSPACAGLLLR
jgi:hypothetical protein